MFEKIGRMAEGMAGGVGASRRGFLGRLGRAALGAAGALGVAAADSAARAGGGAVCCKYQGQTWYEPRKKSYYYTCLPAGSTCPALDGYGDRLVQQKTVSDCTQCG
jgi:hypothetical protein